MPFSRESKTTARTTARRSDARVGQVYRLVREKWPEYLVEMLVIVFSISASFALDEWKENQSKRALEQTYLRGLATDLRADSSHLAEVILETNAIVGKARHLLTPATPEAVKAPSGEFLDELRFIFRRPRFIAEDATFSDLKSSGNLQVVDDFPLKNSLFDYYRQYTAIEQVETAERDATTHLIAPFFAKQLPLVPDRVATASVNAARIAALRTNVEFRNNVFIRQVTREELLRDYRQLLELNGELRRRLNEATTN